MCTLLFIAMLYLDSFLTAGEVPCSTKKNIEVLPGRGYDSLTNHDLGQVLSLSYNDCKTTIDGKFLIPDNVDSVMANETQCDVRAEMMVWLSNFTSITATSFRVNAGLNSSEDLFLIQGSFSTEYGEIKRHYVRERSAALRIYFKSTVYILQSIPESDLNPELKKVLNDTIEALESGNEERAEALLEFVVRDYGTHYITQVDAGAILHKQDYVSMKYVYEHWNQTDQLEFAAKALFSEELQLPELGNSRQYSRNMLTSDYKKLITTSGVKAIGGSMFTPGSSVNQWLQDIPENLATIDRSGDPLSFLVTPARFPGVSPDILKTLRKKMDSAIVEYYSYNKHAGCTNVDSANFDYSANIDDNSCETPSNNYTFGGAYQTCQNLKSDNGNLCNNLEQKNYLTGSYSCPAGYHTISLHSGIHSETGNQRKCSESCSGWWLWKKCWEKCHYEHPESKAEYKSYWCAAGESVPGNTGFMFGGLYSSSLSNPVTREKRCPSSYLTIKIGVDLNVCVSTDYETGYKFSVPFGGFSSCSSSNPLAAKNDETKRPRRGSEHVSKANYSCPGGYTQHTATIDSNCLVSYCVQANSFTKVNGPARLVRPPFRSEALLFDVEKPSKDELADWGSPLTGLFSSVCVVILFTVIVAAIYFYKTRKRQQSTRHEAVAPVARLALVPAFPDEAGTKKHIYNNVVNELQQPSRREGVVPAVHDKKSTKINMYNSVVNELLNKHKNTKA